MKHTPRLRKFLLGSALLAAVSGVNAQTWDGSFSGSWNTAANWNTPASVPGSGADVIFDGTGINLNTATNAAFTLDSLTFTSGQTAAVTINTTPTNNITLNNGGSITVAGGDHILAGNGTSGTDRDLVFSNTSGASFSFDIASGSSFDIQGRIGGSGFTADFTKTGAGTLILSTNNGGSGSWNLNSFDISAGAVRFAASNAGGNSGNSFTVASGAALEFTGGSNQFVNAGSLTLSGNGIAGTRALRRLSGNNAYTGGSGTGAIILAANASIGADTGSTLTLSPAVTGGFALTKVGAAKLVLNHATNSYSGATTVGAGTLAVNGALTATTGVTVQSGATLQGSGSINSTVTIQNGGTLASGNSIQSLATGALSLEALATFAYEIDNDAAPGAAGDLTAVTGNLTLDLANTTILTLSELGSGAWTVGEKLTLISYTTGGWNGGLFNYDGGTLADGSTFNFSGMDWQFDYNDTLAGSNFTGDLPGGSSFVTMAAIPEPSAVALLGGLGCLLLLRRRRI